MKFFVLMLMLLFSLNAQAKSEFGHSENVESVTILASTSLTIPLTELALKYTRDHAVDVNVVYGNSVDLIEQIDEGEPADIAIFSDFAGIRNLQGNGLIDPKTISKIARNRLVLVSSKKKELPNFKNLEAAIDGIFSKNLSVIGDPVTTNLGAYTKQALNKLGRWDKFERFFILGLNSAKTADLIIKSQTVGVIYATDYDLNSANLKLIATFPESTHKPVEYTGAVLIGDNMAEARNFLKYLSSSAAKQVLKKYGFGVE